MKTKMVVIMLLVTSPAIGADYEPPPPPPVYAPPPPQAYLYRPLAPKYGLRLRPAKWALGHKHKVAEEPTRRSTTGSASLACPPQSTLRVLAYRCIAPPSRQPRAPRRATEPRDPRRATEPRDPRRAKQPS
jgi:hypothetical protein